MFTRRAIEFLDELRQHNDRDWFAERKAVYEAECKLPMEQLVADVAAGTRAKGFPLFPKERGAVTRIYRDTRFFPERGPFHHHVGGVLNGKKQPGEMYIHVSPESCFVAAGIYMPDPALLRAIRTRIAERPTEFTALLKQLRGKRLTLADEWKLKRIPRGFETFAGTPVSEYLKYNCFIASRPLERADIESPKLVAMLVRFALDVRPLLEFLWGLNQRRGPILLD